MILKSKTACFSGYRPEKFSFPLEADCEAYINLQASITHAIGESVQVGYSRFLSGMARGFDLICAAILLEMKEMSSAYADVELVAVLPFAGHGFKGRWGDIHNMILEQVDEVVTLSDKHHRAVYLARNQYMVEQSGRLLCYYDGQSGGTAHTARWALRQGLEIHNLADYDLQADPFLNFLA
jgi:Uncharacterized protein conserved in bacteria